MPIALRAYHWSCHWLPPWFVHSYLLTTAGGWEGGGKDFLVYSLYSIQCTCSTVAGAMGQGYIEITRSADFHE